MPLYNYNRPLRTQTPGGRGLNPETGRIGSMPGGLDYLAGYGPAPAGVTDVNVAPIIQTGILGNPQGNSRYNAAASALQRFWPAILRNAASTIPKWSPQMGSVATNLLNTGQVQMPQTPLPTIPQAPAATGGNPWLGLQGAGQIYGMAPQQDSLYGLPPMGTKAGPIRY